MHILNLITLTNLMLSKASLYMNLIGNIKAIGKILYSI